MKVVPYKESDQTKKEQVATMFNNISSEYDRLNRLLSMRVDVYWRKKAIQLLKKEQPTPSLILDVATGTGDFAISALKLNPTKVVGVDISEGMLNVGREKMKKRQLSDKVELLLGDSEKLDFPDNTFDAVTVAFGVRNFENLEKGMSDIFRVLKPNGTLLVLEFSKPQMFPMKQLYNFYFKNILPHIGRVISKDQSAYSYLPESVKAFPDGEAFNQILEQIGFKSVKCVPLTFGISSAYLGKKLS